MSTTYLVVAGDPRVDGLLAAASGSVVTAVVVGPRAVAEAVAGAGVDAVTWLGDPGEAALEAYAGPVARLLADARPDLVLASTRPADRALAGAAAAALAAPVLTMASRVAVSDGSVEVTQGAFGGIATRTVRVTGPAVVVLDSGSVATGGSAPITEVAAEPAAVTVVETRPAERAQADLGRAQRIVAVGRGLKSSDDLAAVDALAAALGAETACSRPLAEGLGWFAKDRYVGITGQHVRPDLYVAVGISGQLQHTVGARDAGTVVAINADEDCPYFAEADYCVVGDLYRVVPALTEALA